MKMKKLISLGLAATLCLSLFAGCGNKDTDNGDGKTPNVTEAPSNVDNTGEDSTGEDNTGEENTDDGARFVENIYDMGGKTITICDTWFWDDLAGDPSGFSRWQTNALAVIEQIEADYNVNIEFMQAEPWEISENVATSAAAGQVYANITVTRSDWNNSTTPWVHSYAADLSTIQNLGLATNDWEECSDLYLNNDGEQIGVSFKVAEEPAENLLVMCFNKELAEQYEIEDIYELVRNNEWTYDKFEEICQDITTKSNGAVKGLMTPEAELGYLAVANNIDVVIEQDGKYVYNGLSNEVINGLEFAQGLVSSGLFDMDTFNVAGSNGERSHQFGREHKTLFFMCNYDWVVSDIDYRLEDYGIVPLPMGPDSDEYVGILKAAKMFNFIEGDPDIEDAAAVLVAIATRLSVTDEEYVQYQYDRGYLRDEESFEFMNIMEENKVSTVEFNYVPHTKVYSLDQTVRQFLEEGAQSAQASIDKNLNK